MLKTTFTTPVTREMLHEWIDFSKSESIVSTALVALENDTNKWMHFIVAYAGWNGRFANGVAALASFIGEQKNLFKDNNVPAIVADRSNYIASFVFDAARDEYDDHIQEHRDTHRCLGQATIMGAAEFFNVDLKTLVEPQWLHSFSNSVLAGYTGTSVLQDSNALTNLLPGELRHRIFQGIGYHLGSELLADREFSIVDSYWREQKPDLVHHLLHYKATFAGGPHRGYAWIGIHSGANDGGGVEDEHFRYALQGVNEALHFIPVHLNDECVLALRQGFLRFAHEHEHFFQRAGQVTE